MLMYPATFPPTRGRSSGGFGGSLVGERPPPYRIPFSTAVVRIKKILNFPLTIRLKRLFFIYSGVDTSIFRAPRRLSRLFSGSSTTFFSDYAYSSRNSNPFTHFNRCTRQRTNNASVMWRNRRRGVRRVRLPAVM